MSDSLVVTGIRSGLGKAIHQALGGFGLNRDNSDELLKQLQRDGAQTIIHCAGETERTISTQSLDVSLRNNLGLTAQLLKIPHQNLVYISSVDIYPKDLDEHCEEDEIDFSKASSAYSMVKLLSEELVLTASPKALILRPSSLLGRHARRGNLLRLILDDAPELTLSPESQMNVILHSDVVKFIRNALAQNLNGIFNLVVQESATLGEIAKFLGKKPKYGEFQYRAGRISNKKAKEILPELNRSTLDSIRLFINESTA